MLSRLFNFVRGLFCRSLVHLVVVRRYRDANGHNVGELYMYGIVNSKGTFRLVGCSLDSLPLDLTFLSLGGEPGALDLDHDFLAPMPPGRLRVGAAEPADNDAVRRMVGRLPRRRTRVTVQNRFIEHVMERKA